MYECAPKTGSRGEVTAIDSEAVLSELSRGNFATSTNAGTYSPETLTTSYIGGLFTALKNVENYWKECVRYTRNYIENFENIPLPEDFNDDSGFLDETEYATSVSATLTGVTSSLNIRSSASKDSDKIGSLKPGSEIKEVLGETVDESGTKWYKIKTDDGKEGYVSSDYVNLKGNPEKIAPASTSQTSVEQAKDKPTTPLSQDKTSTSQESTTNTPSSQTSEGSGEVTNPNNETDDIGVVKLNDAGSHLNIRSTPNSSNSGNIIGQFGNNEKITILGEENGFYRIKTRTGVGYVSKDYVSLSSQDK